MAVHCRQHLYQSYTCLKTINKRMYYDYEFNGKEVGGLKNRHTRLQKSVVSELKLKAEMKRRIKQNDWKKWRQKRERKA